VGTIFHHTHAPLQKWFLALSLILNAKKGISARNLARELDVHRNTGWFMVMRIRRAMTESPEERELLQGIVEMDEAYFGGKPRKGGPKSKRGRGTRKTPVIGIVQRDGNVVAKPVKNIKAKTLSQFVRDHVDLEKSTTMTDAFAGYLRLGTFIRHYSVDHRVEYVSGNIHTNSIESYWALLKRGMIGQYHRVSGRYLPRYVDEFSWRWNNRKNINAFERTLRNALGVVA
jgi:transposase-like protein